jgi:dienelactone hydrolase
MRLLAVLAICLFASATQAVTVRDLSWSLDGTDFAGHLVYEEGSTARPGLVMVPNWMGVNASQVEKAKAIAARGYVVLVADVYGASLRPANAEEAGQAAGAMYAQRELLRARAARAVEVLREQAGSAPLDSARIGAIGFCFGGTTVLELARAGSEIAGVVSFHGGLATSLPAQAGAVKAPMLVLNGADDPLVSADEIAAFQAEVRAAGADWQFVNFAGAVHCFAEADANWPPNCLYHERSAKRAYRMMDDFFAEAMAP